MILWRECEPAEATPPPLPPIAWIDLPVAPNHYRTLGLPPNASPTDIKLAYRSLVQRFHPDAHPDANFTLAEEVMKRLNQAYAVLRSPETRGAYDRSLGFHPQ